MKKASQQLAAVLLGIVACMTVARSADELAPLTPKEVEDVMLRVENLDDGDDVTYELEMLLIDRTGSERRRKMHVKQKDFGKSGSDRYTFINVDYPQSLQGTRILSYDFDEPDADDLQWIYLNDLKKVKRIASTDKTASFMGSDITFADLTERKVRNYNFKFIKHAAVNGRNAWVIEMIPKTPQEVDKFGYTKALLWIDKESNTAIRSVFWVKDTDLLKYFDVYKLAKVDGIWTQLEYSFMTKRGDEIVSRTNVRAIGLKYNQHLRPDDFRATALEG
ncbi:MAG: outer membrane lipoprotein-sorting protein [Gammaproteobacteria bacterium]|nr:outer membrane lipoprotein-sorting protein [Gammaproteobacteria bacterium]